MSAAAAPVPVGMYIDGAWTRAGGAGVQERTSPVTGKPHSLVATADRTDVQTAIAAAGAARAAMVRLSPHQRAELCAAVSVGIDRRRAELAEALSLEQGKPLAEARAEVGFATQLYWDAAGAISHLSSEVLPARDPGKRVITLRQPHGVVGVITPWNFPIGIPSEYLSAAVATGNTVVWKPAPTTPHTAALLMECLAEAGLPAGAVNLVHGDAEVGDEVVSNRGVHAVGFTGSARIGELVAQRAGAKPLLLELGGNGPTVILDDADLARAVPATAQACFQNAGQICQSSERILVGPRVREQVVAGLAEAAAGVRLGHPLAGTTTMGPLNNQTVATTLDQHIADGRDRGAVVVTGGQRAGGFPTDLYYLPTVIDAVPTDALLNREETFGPIAPVVAVEDLDHAIAVANECDLGLAAAVFSQDLAKAIYCAERLECGVVNINEHAAYWDGLTPFGGFSGKRSGVGRLGGTATLLSLTQLKSVVMEAR